MNCKTNERQNFYVFLVFHVTDAYTYTDHDTTLIQTSEEPLRNKQIFT